MSQAKSGDSVKIHYTGTLDDGTQFDSSAGRDPLAFELASGQVIPGFDKAVEGPDGQVFNLVITAVKDDAVTVDGNHPLAGKALNFDIELVSIG
jgi:peptidylprolyl isomerase